MRISLVLLMGTKAGGAHDRREMGDVCFAYVCQEIRLLTRLEDNNCPDGE